MKYEIKEVNGVLVPDEKAVELMRKYQAINLKLVKAKMEMDEFKAAMKDAMEKNGVKHFENSFVSITYVPETIRKVIDSKALKEQGLYDSFVKESKVKSSLKVSFKDE